MPSSSQWKFSPARIPPPSRCGEWSCTARSGPRAPQALRSLGGWRRRQQGWIQWRAAFNNSLIFEFFLNQGYPDYPLLNPLLPTRVTTEPQYVVVVCDFGTNDSSLIFLMQ